MDWFVPAVLLTAVGLVTFVQYLGSQIDGGRSGRNDRINEVSNRVRRSATELRGEMSTLRTEMWQLRSKLRTEMWDLRTEIRTEMRDEMRKLRTEMRRELGKLRNAQRDSRRHSEEHVMHLLGMQIDGMGRRIENMGSRIDAIQA